MFIGRQYSGSHARLTNPCHLAAILLALNGCASLQKFGHQVAATEPHALIEIAPPGKFWVAGREVGVKAVDGIDLPYRPGKVQSFRVRPGKHVISYFDSGLEKEITSFKEMNPLEQSAALVTVGGIQLAAAFGGGVIPLKLEKAKSVYPTKEIEVVAGRRYYFQGYRILESELDGGEESQGGIQISPTIKVLDNRLPAPSRNACEGQTPSHPVSAPRPGPTRPGPLKSNFAFDHPG